MRRHLVRRSRARRNAASAGALLLGAVLTASGAAGQAICSAPHSSPYLAQNGSIQTLYPGAGWVQLSFFGQRATEAYDPAGASGPFLADSRFTTSSVFLTAALGVIDGLEVWAQVPHHWLGVSAASGESTSAGLGDVRVAARVSSELLGSDLPVALRVGAKLPGSTFPVDATVIPLTEGQTDWEVSLESGGPIASLPLYVAGWVGYRWRTENALVARKPGAEGYAHLALGGSAGQLTWEVGLDGLWGGTPLAQGIPLTQQQRRLIQVQPTIGYPVGPGRLEATALVPIGGRNLPVFYGLSAGYRVGWGL